MVPSLYTSSREKGTKESMEGRKRGGSGFCAQERKAVQALTKFVALRNGEEKPRKEQKMGGEGRTNFRKCPIGPPKEQGGTT